jgi:hypothetical protein
MKITPPSTIPQVVTQSKLKFHDQVIGMFVKMVGNNISMLKNFEEKMFY